MSKDDFKKLIEEIQNRSWYKQPLGFGIAKIDRGQKDSSKVLQANYPFINWNENFGSAAVLLNAIQDSGQSIAQDVSEQVFDVTKDVIAKAKEYFTPYLDEAIGDSHKNVQVIKALDSILASGASEDDFKIAFIYANDKPLAVETVYLKLYALSTGKAKLRTLNLNGAFGILQNCAWAGNQPIELSWLRENEIELKFKGEYPDITGVDKFPRFLSHVIPQDNTRILDTGKVRFGAQLAAGTTVMPGASYINFNAGTKGPVMVEGRISSSAIVGAGSDIGGGASILGVLSGTDGVPISIGEDTLLGANCVVGTSIGNACIIDAGVSILPGTKINLNSEAIKALEKINPGKKFSESMKGQDFQGVNGVHFRVDSTTGKTIAMRSTREVKLNDDLH